MSDSSSITAYSILLRFNASKNARPDTNDDNAPFVVFNIWVGLLLASSIEDQNDLTGFWNSIYEERVPSTSA